MDIVSSFMFLKNHKASQTLSEHFQLLLETRALCLGCNDDISFANQQSEGSVTDRAVVHAHYLASLCRGYV